jgi:hypothetical protein
LDLSGDNAGLQAASFCYRAAMTASRWHPNGFEILS